MKRYTVTEKPCSGSIFANAKLNYMLKGAFNKKNRKGGVVVFPEDIMDVDTSPLDGRFKEIEAPPDRFTVKDGTCYSGTSICIDIKDYSSGSMMSLAMMYSRTCGRTVLLKDFEYRKLYTVHFNNDHANHIFTAA